jgi:hypothetical protein
MVFEYKKNEAGHYVCGICGEVKERQNTMHYHLKKHEGTMPHECSQCHKRFYQKYALDDHMKTRHPAKPDEVASLACPFGDCDQKFHKKLHLRVHIARNHVREMVDKWIKKQADTGHYTCTCCNSDYKSHPAILYHVMDHAKAHADPETQKKLLIV